MGWSVLFVGQRHVTMTQASAEKSTLAVKVAVAKSAEGVLAAGSDIN